MTAVSTALIAVHEAGHVIAGRLVGLSWKSWEVGALRVSREGGRWRFSLGKRWQGGLVNFLPFQKRVTRLQLAISLLGGAVANVLFGIVLLAYVIHRPLQEQIASTSLGWAGSIAGMSFLMGVFNLFPFRLKRYNLYSDGLQLWWLLRGGKAYREYYAQWERYDALKVLYAAWGQGKRPREWDATQVRRATTHCDGSESEGIANYWAFYWAADSGDWPESGRHIGRAVALLETLPHVQRIGVLLDAAYYEGLYRRDSASARVLMERAAGMEYQDSDDETLRRAMTLRAEAAALLAEGKPGEAERRAREALASLVAVTSDSGADRCLIELLLSHCSRLATTETETPTAKE